jgi:chemotaxis family two-component system response regulator Rcp1
MSIEQLKPISILLVEDNPADIRLTEEALKECKLVNSLSVVTDGEAALAHLRREGEYTDVSRPDLVLLDLNLPRKSGQEVLAEMRADEDLKSIPVVVLTASRAEKDVIMSYDLSCNCYVIKPLDFDQFNEVVQAIQDFWFTIVKLPPTGSV